MSAKKTDDILPRARASLHKINLQMKWKTLLNVEI